MIDRQHPLPVVPNCQLLALARSSVDAVPPPVSAATLAVMRQLDELHLQHPFAGSRLLHDLLRLQGVVIGRKHVATLMRRMGIAALYQHPRTTQPHPGHTVFPYLFRARIHGPESGVGHGHHLHPDAPGLRLPCGRAGLGHPARFGLAPLEPYETDFCLDALEAAIRDCGLPTILNTDQGSQFTGTAFVGLVQQHGIQLSMDGKGSWRDNLFIERLWKSVKCEDVYLHAYASVTAARHGLTRYFTFYNQGRPHTALDGQTPDMVYFALLPQREAA